MRLRTALELGRVSNLATVASNVLAAVALTGARCSALTMLVLIAAMSLAYVAGMFLNDAFDRRLDAQQRPDRPIPSGRIQARAVFGWGFGMLLASIVLVGAAAIARGSHFAQSVVGASVLAALIVLYDAWHKGNPFAPVLMGSCRAAVYASAALVMVGELSRSVVVAGALLCAYVAGLTYAAKQEHLGRIERAWPLALLFSPSLFYVDALFSSRLAALLYVAFSAWVIITIRPLVSAARKKSDVPRAVVRLIAGIALFDALVAARADDALSALAGVAAFASTLGLQRLVRGT